MEQRHKRHGTRDAGVIPTQRIRVCSDGVQRLVHVRIDQVLLEAVVQLTAIGDAIAGFELWKHELIEPLLQGTLELNLVVERRLLSKPYGFINAGL